MLDSWEVTCEGYIPSPLFLPTFSPYRIPLCFPIFLFLLFSIVFFYSFFYSFFPSFFHSSFPFLFMIIPSSNLVFFHSYIYIYIFALSSPCPFLVLFTAVQPNLMESFDIREGLGAHGGCGTKSLSLYEVTWQWLTVLDIVFIGN